MKLKNIIAAVLCSSVMVASFAQDKVQVQKREVKAVKEETKDQVKQEVKEIKEEAKEVKREGKEVREEVKQTRKLSPEEEARMRAEREAKIKEKREMMEKEGKESERGDAEYKRERESSEKEDGARERGTGTIDGVQRGVAVREAGISKEDRIARQNAHYEAMAKRESSMSERMDMAERKLAERLANGEITQEEHDQKMAKLQDMRRRMSEVSEKQRMNKEKFERTTR